MNQTNQINNKATLNQFNQFVIDDLRTKFEKVFNQSDQLSNKLKSIEILNIRKLNQSNQIVNRTYQIDIEPLNVNRNVNMKENLSHESFKNSSPNNSSFLIYSDLSLNSSSLTDQKLDDFLGNKFLIEFKIIFKSNELDFELSASSVYLTISNELIKSTESLFYHFNLDQSSLSIKEIYPEDQLDKTIQNLLRLVLKNSTSILTNRRLKRLQLIKLNRLNRTNQMDNLDDLDLITIDNQTEHQNKKRIRCEKTKLSFCSFLPYDKIMYPNLVGHQNQDELETEFIYFRQIIDSECFYLAKEIICLITQPSCSMSDPSIDSINHQNLLCADLCERFMIACSIDVANFLPKQIRDNLMNSCVQLTKLQSNVSSLSDSFLNDSFKNETTIIFDSRINNHHRQLTDEQKTKTSNNLVDGNSIVKTSEQINSTTTIINLTSDVSSHQNLSNLDNLNSEIVSNWKTTDYLTSFENSDRNLVDTFLVVTDSTTVSPNETNDYLTNSTKKEKRDLKNSDNFRNLDNDDALGDFSSKDADRSKIKSDLFSDSISHKATTNLDTYKDNLLTSNQTSTNGSSNSNCLDLKQIEQLSMRTSSQKDQRI